MYAKTPEDIERCKKEGRCINCGELFSEENVFAPAGWMETNISQLCEKCFDMICGGPEDEDVDYDYTGNEEAF